MLTTILLVFSLVFLIIATVGVPAPPRLNFLAAGMACLVAAILFGHLPLPG